MSFLAGLGAMGPAAGGVMGKVATKAPMSGGMFETMDLSKILGGLGALGSAATPKREAPQALPPHDFRNPYAGAPVAMPSLATRLTGLEGYGR